MPERQHRVRAFVFRYVIALGVVTVLTASGVAIANRTINDTVSRIERVNLARLADPPPAGANYLILGSDVRDPSKLTEEEKLAYCDPVRGCEGGQRSDTMMVAHVEPGAKRTTIVSFPRDLLVTIPGGYGKDRINAAYSYGGPDLVISTLTTNFQIDVHHYLEVDFLTFKEIVEAIGSVEISFPYQTRDPDYSGFDSHTAGCVALKGDDALAYVRSRSLEQYINGRWQDIDLASPDLHRIERQQGFIKKLAGLAVSKSLDDPFLAKEIAYRVLEHIIADQNLSRGDVNSLLRAFRNVDVNDSRALDFRTIPTREGEPYRGMSVLYQDDANLEPVLNRLRSFDDSSGAVPTVAPGEIRVGVLDGIRQGAIDEGNVHATLVKAGFLGAGSGSTKAVDVSEIRYRPDQIGAARTLAGYVEDARLVADETIKSARLTLVVGQSFKTVTVPSTTTTTAPPSTAVGAPTTTSTSTTTTTTRPTTTTTQPDLCA